LGIDWDEGPEVGGPHGPYQQSQRTDLYQDAVRRLLSSGAAYRDYSTTEEVRSERDAAQQAKRPFVYSRRWMATCDEDAARLEAEGRKAVIRLKMPREGSLVIDDLVRGPVEFQWGQEQDHVIQRADGSCLYHLANVVDDHEFQITHVIRAEEHLSNTPRQIFIARALDYELPKYAHLPCVAEPGSKTKLSKRKLSKYLKDRDFALLMDHGREIAQRLGLATDPETFNPVIVDFYRQVGYLPQAILNYLALLGWSLDDKTEHFTQSQLIEHFSLDRVNKAPASFDPQKLQAFQQQHMLELPDEEKVAMVLPYLQKAGFVPAPAPNDAASKVSHIVKAAGDRIKVAGDVLDYVEFFTSDDQLPYEEKPFEKRLRKPPDAKRLLLEFRDELASTASFDATSLEQLLGDFVQRKGIKVGQVIHALRVAVTGKSVGFGVFETLEILGKASCLARIDRALERT
jgi:glutamyl-tRNA synthetase